MEKLLRAESNATDGNLSLRHEPGEIVLSRRTAFLNKYGVTSEDCVFMQTEHEDKITHVTTSDKGSLITTEAFITKDTRLVLFLLTGDCFPVSFYDPINGVIALAHLGWKPADKGLVIKVIKEMNTVYGSQPTDITVHIGPGIQKESYKFVDPVQKQMPAWSDFLTVIDSGETTIDLAGFIKTQALEVGVTPNNIEMSTVDTATSDKYFSHYRSVRTGDPEARFATILGLL